VQQLKGSVETALKGRNIGGHESEEEQASEQDEDEGV